MGDGARLLGEDGRAVRIPLDQDLALFHGLAGLDRGGLEHGPHHAVRDGHEADVGLVVGAHFPGQRQRAGRHPHHPICQTADRTFQLMK